MNLRIGRAIAGTNIILLTDVDEHNWIAQLRLQGNLMSNLSYEEKKELMKAVFDKLVEIKANQKSEELKLVYRYA